LKYIQDILLDGLFDMSFEDAGIILKGGETAATDYFRKQSWQQLYDAFRPQMAASMSRFKVAEEYNKLVTAYNKIPFTSKPELVSADAYATNKALEGIFYLVAGQERVIRTDPKARVTDLLKRVFSS